MAAILRQAKFISRISRHRAFFVSLPRHNSGVAFVAMVRQAVWLVGKMLTVKVATVCTAASPEAWRVMRLANNLKYNQSISDMIMSAQARGIEMKAAASGEAMQ